MPNFTPNVNLEKPLQTDFYDVNVQNSNMDKIDNAFTTSSDKLNQHIIDNVAHVRYAVNTSINDSYQITLPDVTEYKEGMIVSFKATVANTTTCSLNINNLGAKTINKFTNAIDTLETGDILANQIVTVVYSGTSFIMISNIANTITSRGSQFLYNKTLESPRIPNNGFIADSVGNEQIKFMQTASAVNEFTVKNASTSNAPELQATGNDANIDINLVPKGTGTLKVKGAEVALQTSVSNVQTNIDGVQNNLTNHINDNTKHKTASDITRIAGAAQKTGDTFSGDIIISKGIPALTLKTPAGNAILDFFLNASNTNNFGAFLRLDGLDLLRFNARKNIQFEDNDGIWTSLADLKSSVSNGKTLVANAITGKGVTTSPTAEFATMANNISKIQTGRLEAKGVGTTFSDTFLTVTGIAFTPKIIMYWRNSTTGHGEYAGTYIDAGVNPAGFTVNFGKTIDGTIANAFSIQANGFVARTNLSGGSFLWLAFS